LVSSLAYPNLLGTKGYVVVVVVFKREKTIYILIEEAYFSKVYMCNPLSKTV
jgi:hypothetical protein